VRSSIMQSKSPSAQLQAVRLSEPKMLFSFSLCILFKYSHGEQSIMKSFSERVQRFKNRNSMLNQPVVSAFETSSIGEGSQPQSTSGEQWNQMWPAQWNQMWPAQWNQGTTQISKSAHEEESR
jgi:hypothetical protein